MEGGTDENLSFAGYFWQFRAVFSYCTVQKTNFVINLKTRTLCQIKNMRFWSYAIHISTFLAYLSLRFTAENSSLQFVRSIACTAANDDDNDGKWNIYCSKPSSPLQNKFVMYLFVDRQNENVKIVQNGKVLDKAETESIVLYRKRATKFNQIAISILYSSLVAFFLANMFSNWRGTLYDYLTWPITLLASIYLPITNFFMIFFFLMVVRYIRIKQQCIKVKVAKILKKNQADFSTLKTTSGISHSRQTSFKRINAKMLSIYEEIKGQNQTKFGQRLTLTTLGHCERPPTRAPLAPLARPESVDVHSAQVSSDLAALSYLVKQRLTVASLGSPKTPADSDLARSAREALVGGRFW
ncbi:hypothetical protein TYRP_022099 [Tyrophagus putrescentiae]|nr:hypothetical protein TYRP_022099 [Tyrophagus putrescentiae]